MFVNRRLAPLFRVQGINPHERHQDARWALWKDHFATTVNIKKTYLFLDIVSNLNLPFLCTWRQIVLLLDSGFTHTPFLSG